MRVAFSTRGQNTYTVLHTVSEYWNSITWLNTAIDIAESLGLHQLRVDGNTKVGPQIELQTMGMCKRIWWTLVWRDAFGSAISGSPLRIDLSQCSTPRPHPLDPGQQQISQQICDLGLILRSIIRFRFLNKDSKMVERFVSNTLRTLSSLNLTTSNSSLAMRLSYNHVLIYLCQTSQDFYEESSLGRNPTIELFMKSSVEEVLATFRMLLGSQSLTMVAIPLDVLGVCLESKTNNDTERLVEALESFGVVKSMLEMVGQQWDHAVQICALLDALNARAELPLSLPLVEGSVSNLIHDNRDNRLADSPVQCESLAYDEEAEKLLSMLWGYEE
ncbi:hypothetical protein BZA70DRAFT_302644 [Myxozyma melibiosi]|uniref:Xylanolytic transcriptional activator regulatory domain-containing protein n=1 Tax=Myxozyma melibiosi TaxID=54550 RepID=A0ABR1EZM2_9ASCO